jgi:hypothetical protein
VWYGYGKVYRLPSGYTFKLPQGWSFEQAATAMTGQENAVIDFEKFNAEELGTQLRPAQVTKKNLKEALASLGGLGKTPIRPYSVAYDSSRYVLTVKG